MASYSDVIKARKRSPKWPQTLTMWGLVCQRSRVEPDHERWPPVRCGGMAPPGCSPWMDRGERCRIDMEPARAPGNCHDRQKSSYHVSQRCVDVLQAGDVRTREKAPARLVDQRKCEWILSKPNALSGALAGLRGDDLTAAEGARRRSSNSKACRPRPPWLVISSRS